MDIYVIQLIWVCVCALSSSLSIVFLYPIGCEYVFQCHKDFGLNVQFTLNNLLNVVFGNFPLNFEL